MNDYSTPDTDPTADWAFSLAFAADQQWAADQAAGGFAALACGYGPAVAAPVAPAVAPVYPISLTIKGHIQGQDAMLTIRGADVASMQAQMAITSQWFDPPASATQSTPVETGEGWCAIHQVQMNYNVAKPGKGEDWYSHKTAEGFCKGYAPKGVRR